MKSFIRSIIPTIILLFTLLPAYSQITINNTLYTPTQLVDGVLVPTGSGTTISNVVFRGVYNDASRYQVGYFSTATTTLAQMGFTSGVVLSTGNTSTIPLTLGVHPGSVGQMATSYGSCTTGEIRQGGTCPAGINDLDVLAGAQNYFNAAVLEFDFVPVENSVTFRYIFGSEEYTDDSGFINYQCSSYNDKFGFLISGPGIAGGQGFTNNARNIARLSNGSEVSINSVNNGVVGSSGGAPNAANCIAANGSWVQNTPTPEYLGIIDGTQLNGNTRILTATQTGLTPGQTYHIKLIVTDVNDGTYDSVVYLEAGSFTTESTCDAGSNQSLCDTTSATLAATSPATGTWSVQSGSGTFVSATNPSTTVNGLALGTNVLRWTASDLSCFDEITITVGTSPAAPTVGAVTHPTCSVATGSFQITGYNAANTYTFTPSVVSISGTGLVTANAGTYTFTLTNASGCTSSASSSLSIDSVPSSPIVSTVSGCNGAIFEITASVDSGMATYEWYDSSSNLIGTTATIAITESGTYEVIATVNSCTTTEFVTVDKSPCVIPKGVSPNNDGLNDTWNLSGLNAKKVQIFNRYGVEVYSKSDYTNEWEGKTNSGDELPSATYYYVVSLPNGEVKTGWVYINREN